MHINEPKSHILKALGAEELPLVSDPQVQDVKLPTLIDENERGYTWNHRVINTPSKNGGEDWYTFQEVGYENGVPTGYGDACMGGDTVKELTDLVARLQLALTKPVLHEDDFK